MTNSQGHPISYELFPGNTSEGATLVESINKLKTRFNVRRAVLVADRAMFVRKNLETMDKMGIEYVVAAKLKSLSSKKKEEVLSYKNYKPTQVACDTSHLFWVKELEHEGKRLIVSYSNKRAKRDQNQRERLINRLMKKVRNKEIPVSQLISNHGTKRFIKVDDVKVTIDEEKMEKEALWDGLHGIITNVQNKTASELLSRYRSLWRIEEAFRVNKTTLKMRPVYHWKKRRIETHIAICFLAYAISYTMVYKLKQAGLNLSFERMRKILKRDQYSILEEKKTKKLYRLPSGCTKEVEEIYSAFSLKRNSSMSLIPTTSVDL